MAKEDIIIKEEAKEDPKSDKIDHFKYLKYIIKLTVKVIIVLLTLMLIYTVAEFSFLVAKGFIRYNSGFNLSSMPFDRERLFFTQVQGLISAALLLTILIEFIQSLIGYIKTESNNYVALITEIALIAIVRHILTIDLEHINAGVLFGLSSLIFVLGLFYILVDRKFILFRQDNS